MLDYSIRSPLAPTISPGFYGWTSRGGSSSSFYTVTLYVKRVIERERESDHC
jgi:hypothetical protein